MPKTDFIFDGKFDEEYFNEVREKRLINLLAQEASSSNDIRSR